MCWSIVVFYVVVVEIQNHLTNKLEAWYGINEGYLISSFVLGLFSIYFYFSVVVSTLCIVFFLLLFFLVLLLLRFVSFRFIRVLVFKFPILKQTHNSTRTTDCFGHRRLFRRHFFLYIIYRERVCLIKSINQRKEFSLFFVLFSFHYTFISIIIIL